VGKGKQGWGGRRLCGKKKKKQPNDSLAYEKRIVQKGRASLLTSHNGEKYNGPLGAMKRGTKFILKK